MKNCQSSNNISGYPVSEQSSFDLLHHDCWQITAMVSNFEREITSLEKQNLHLEKQNEDLRYQLNYYKKLVVEIN